MRQLAMILFLSLCLIFAGGQTVGDTAAVAPAPAEDIASTTSSTEMNLQQIARSGPPGYSTCVFKLQGTAGSSNSVAVRSAASTVRNDTSGAQLSQASISCSGGSQNITIQGGPALEPFSGNWKGVTYIKNINLPGSTMTFRGEKMVISNSTFNGLQSFGYSALVFANSNITFLNSTFFNNNNSASGCIYSNESSVIQILDSNFTNNYGLSAGAVAIWNSSVVVNNTVFGNNSCNSQGGGISVNNAGTVVVLGSTFMKSTATNGGALYLEKCNTAVLEQNTFFGNQANRSGGAIFQLQCPGSLTSNTFMRNTGANGAAIWHNNLQRVNHTLNLFVQNTGTAGSGGLEFNQVKQMSISNCNFTECRGVKGGAIYLQDVTGDITNTFFGGNQVTTNGGAVFRGTSTGDLSGNNFTNNTANAAGSAIYDSHVSGNIVNNTFTVASGSGSAVFRTVCAGSVSSNINLPTNQITIQQPVSTTG